MKAVVFTLGCKVNECESHSLISGLMDMGYEVYDKLVPADLYIINTCAVTKEAEKKSRQMASRVAKLNPTMWSENLIDNRDYLVNDIDLIVEELLKYKKVLENNDELGLKALLQQGTDIKESLKDK